MNRTDEGALAWALADSAKVFLKPADRARMCAKIGAGEQGSAIKHLLIFYSNTDAELPCELQRGYGFGFKVMQEVTVSRSFAASTIGSVCQPRPTPTINGPRPMLTVPHASSSPSAAHTQRAPERLPGARHMPSTVSLYVASRQMLMILSLPPSRPAASLRRLWKSRCGRPAR